MIRTISELYNYHAERVVDVEEIFLLSEDEVYRLRNKIESFIQNNNPLFACNVCGQVVGLRVYKDHSGYYFSHLYKSNDCPIKTGVNYSSGDILRMKYNGAKESNKHFEIKTYIAKKLEDDPRFTDLEIEKVVKGNGWSKSWKKPDVSAKYKGKRVVFEIQLSTTYLDVIVNREFFYKEQKIPIFWIFSDFEPDNAKATHKDIFYNNWSNVLTIDQNSRELTENEGELFLTGYYKSYLFCKDQEAVLEQWCSMPVKFDLVKFNSENYKPFFFNSQKSKKQALIEESYYLENIKPIKDIEHKILSNYKEMGSSNAAQMSSIEFNNYRYKNEPVYITHSMGMFIMYLMSVRDKKIYFAVHGYTWMANQIWNKHRSYWLFFIRTLDAYNMRDIITNNKRLKDKHEKFKYEYKRGLVLQESINDALFGLFVPNMTGYQRS